MRLKAGMLANHRRVEILDLRQEDGPVFDLIRKAELYVLANIRKRFVIDGSPSREEIPEIPREALREAIVNAFCHRDYSDYGTAVQIDIYPDSVEITNPGAFPAGRTPEMYLSGDSVAPMSRNPLMAQTLFRSKTIEAFGSGLRRIRDACAEALSSDPSLTAAELSDQLGLSSRQVQRAIKELRDGQVIEREGSDKTGTWKILRHPMS